MRAEIVGSRAADAVVVLRVTGEVDLATVAGLDAAFRRAAARLPRSVVCDLTGATFFAVAGVRCLERVSATLMRSGTLLHVVVGGSEAARVLAMVAEPTGWSVHPTMDAALAVVAQPG